MGLHYITDFLWKAGKCAHEILALRLCDDVVSPSTNILPGYSRTVLEYLGYFVRMTLEERMGTCNSKLWAFSSYWRRWDKWSGVCYAWDKFWGKNVPIPSGKEMSCCPLHVFYRLICFQFQTKNWWWLYHNCWPIQGFWCLFTTILAWFLASNWAQVTGIPLFKRICGIYWRISITSSSLAVKL